MVTKCKDHLYIVINAGCFDKDMAHLLREAKKFEDVQIRDLYAERALVAIQGPNSEEVIASLVDKPMQQKIRDLPFMSRLITRVAGVDDCIVSRSGYTGEDGFEISIPKEKAVQWAKYISFSFFIYLLSFTSFIYILILLLYSNKYFIFIVQNEMIYFKSHRLYIFLN